MNPSYEWQNNLQSKRYIFYVYHSSYYRLIFKGKQSKDQHLINYLNERLKSWAKNVNEETK